MLTVRVSKHFNVDFAGVIQLKVLHTYQTVFKRVFFQQIIVPCLKSTMPKAMKTNQIKSVFSQHVVF